MLCGKKRLSTREKFKGDLHWKQCWYRVELQVLLNWLTVLGNLTEHNWIRTNRGGAQKFLGPRGVKYLNTGLVVVPTEEEEEEDCVITPGDELFHTCLLNPRKKKNLVNCGARLAACGILCGGKHGKKNMGTVHKFRGYVRDVLTQCK